MSGDVHKAYTAGFKALAKVLKDHSAIHAHSHLLFVPGPGDPSPLGTSLLPQPRLQVGLIQHKNKQIEMDTTVQHRVCVCVCIKVNRLLCVFSLLTYVCLFSLVVVVVVGVVVIVVIVVIYSCH